MISGSVGVGLGLLSQLLYLLFERWRQMKAIEIHHPELSGREEKTEWTLVSERMYYIPLSRL